MDAVNRLTSLEVKDSPLRGRSIFSRESLTDGTAILHALPYAIGVFPSHRKRLCGFLPCSLVSDSFFETHCTNCDTTYYCSVRCCERDVTHAWVCGGLRKLRGWSKDRHVASVVALVLLVLARAKCEGEASDVIDEDEDDRARSEFFRTLASIPPRDDLSAAVQRLTLYHYPPHPTFADVVSLQSHVDSWSPCDLEDWTSHFSFITSVLHSCAPGLLPVGWTLREILDLASKLESNGFGCFSGEKNVGSAVLSPEGRLTIVPERQVTSRSKNAVCFARAIYPHASFFNHSCIPNAQADRITALNIFSASPGQALENDNDDPSPPVLPLRTIGLGQPLVFSLSLVHGGTLPAGEEITITYISLAQPRSTRRAALASDYFFDCVCQRCEKERKGQRAPKGNKKKSTKDVL